MIDKKDPTEITDLFFKEVLTKKKQQHDPQTRDNHS